MNVVVPGTFHEGRVLLETPVDWPEGAKVEVALVTQGRPTLGITENEWPNTPEAIEEWLRWYDSLEPLEFTREEEADIAAWRKKVKEYDIAKSQRRIEGLFP
jgi:hypothetical protein